MSPPNHEAPVVPAEATMTPVANDSASENGKKLSREERIAIKKAQKKAEKKAEIKAKRKEEKIAVKRKSEEDLLNTTTTANTIHHDAYLAAREISTQVETEAVTKTSKKQKVKKALEKKRRESESISVDHQYMVTTKQHFADRIVAIPEVVQREVQEQAYVAVPRTVVEKEKIIMVKEVVEIPEIEYVDEYVTEEYTQDIYRTIEKPVTIEREVEHIIHVDDVETVLVEVPDVTYDDVVVVKDVHVPTIVEKEVLIERVVPQIQEELIEDINYVYHDREVNRNIPVPVEATIRQKFIAPRIEAVHKEANYRLVLPEFSETAVWSSSVTPEGHAFLPALQKRLHDLPGSSLCELERLFCDVKAVKMEHEDWLHPEMIETRMNLPYMGVERTRVNKPVFVKHEDSHDHFKYQDSKISHQPVKTKSRFCAPKRSRVEVASPQDTVVHHHSAQFIQVENGFGHTTISPTAQYTRVTQTRAH